jgi:hypothetical protein
MATFVPALSAGVGSDDEILVNDQLVVEVCGAQPDEAALKRARKRLYRLITEVPRQHRLPAFKDESGQWACRRGTVKAYRAARQLWLAEQERRAFAAAGLTDVEKNEALAELAPDEYQALVALSEATRPLFLAFYRRKTGEVAQKTA